MIKGAIFDIDGVLLDSMGIWDDLGARYLRSLGRIPEEGLNKILFSMSMEQGAEYLNEHYGLNKSVKETVDGIGKMLEDYYFYEVLLKPGAKEELCYFQMILGLLLSRNCEIFMQKVNLNRRNYILYSKSFF